MNIYFRLYETLHEQSYLHHVHDNHILVFLCIVCIYDRKLFTFISFFNTLSTEGLWLARGQDKNLVK